MNSKNNIDLSKIISIDIIKKIYEAKKENI